MKAKSLCLSAGFLIFINGVMAQVPQGISYQAIARNVGPIQDPFMNDIVSLLLFVGRSNTHLSLLCTQSSCFSDGSYTIVYHIH